MKELATKLNYITERYLDIIGIIFIVVNFIIWDLNTITLRDTQFSLYYLALYFVLVGIIINIKKLNILEYLSEIILFTLLFFVLVYNSYQINMSFHGTYVDMGLRSRELIKLVFPSLFLILLLYRYINPKAFIIGLVLTTGIILFYNIVAIYGKLAKMETLFQLPLLLNNRSQSLLDNPNALGEYAYLGCVFLFILAIISKRLSIKIITLALIPIMLGGLVLSGSRTALLMVISFYVLLLLYYPYYNRQFKNLLIISFLLILGFVLVDYTFHLNFIKEQLRLSEALSGRDKIWKVMMTVINENWLYGVGYNNSTFVFNESGEFSTLTSPHNLYLAVLMEMGIIPFILMVTFFIGLILSNQKLIILNKGNHKTMY
ncbi:MAG: O-antigen ligase family protein, partial [Bacilli bacterium]|nr:O-antigen ligase family protein [Bacilli bacterium]